MVMEMLYQYQYPGCDAVCRFAKCYHWEEMGKGSLGLSVLFPTTAWEPIIISKQNAYYI